VRGIRDRYTQRRESIVDIVRARSTDGALTRTDNHVRDRSTVWGMLRSRAYRGQAAFDKTQSDDTRAKPASAAGAAKPDAISAEFNPSI
jgi:hypothetical protein